MFLMKSGRIVFAVMVLVFLFFELAYAFLVYELGIEYLAGALIKSVVLLFVIALYAARVKLMKWVLTVLVCANALTCLYHAIELENVLLYAISAYSFLFVLSVHRLKMVTSSYG